MAKSRTATAVSAPHSWSLENWPVAVYPHTAGRGRYVIRANRSALVAAGALVRIGRDLVVLGGPYTKWLQSQSDRVDGFEIAPNRPAEAA